jgi:hypothetical protein
MRGGYLGFEGVIKKTRKKKEREANHKTQMTSAENRTSSHAIWNPQESHIFGINTADLPLQTVPRRSSHPGAVILGLEPPVRLSAICFPPHIACTTRTGKMQYDQIRRPRIPAPPTRLQPLFPIRSSLTRKVSISSYVAD